MEFFNRLCFCWYRSCKPYLLLILIVTIIACRQPADKPSVKHKPTTAIQILCDTGTLDTPPQKNYRQELRYWLVDYSLDGFLNRFQTIWREAKAWHKRLLPLDSCPMLKCLGKQQGNLFIYIPHHYYVSAKNADYIRFYLVNQSADTVLVPRIDAIMRNISSSVTASSGKDTANWLSFQQTIRFVECGNSLWTMKFPPGNVLELQMDSEYLQMGDTVVQYRVELPLNGRQLVSNAIPIHLLKKQLPYLGKEMKEMPFWFPGADTLSR